MSMLAMQRAHCCANAFQCGQGADASLDLLVLSMWQLLCVAQQSAVA